MYIEERGKLNVILHKFKLKIINSSIENFMQNDNFQVHTLPTFHLEIINKRFS